MKNFMGKSQWKARSWRSLVHDDTLYQGSFQVLLYFIDCCTISESILTDPSSSATSMAAVGVPSRIQATIVPLLCPNHL